MVDLNAHSAATISNAYCVEVKTVEHLTHLMTKSRMSLPLSVRDHCPPPALPLKSRDNKTKYDRKENIESDTHTHIYIYILGLKRLLE